MFVQETFKNVCIMNNLIKIKVTCQYWENYNTDTINPPYWKPKFGHDFVFEVAFGAWLYDQENVKKWFNEVILPQHNNDMCKFEPVEWEKFEEPEYVGSYVAKEQPIETNK